MDEHMGPIRDVALHPQLMLMLSVSDDGTTGLTDVSSSIKKQQSDSQQQNSQQQQQQLISQQYSTSSISSINSSQFSLQSLKSLTLPIQTQIVPIKTLDPKWLFKHSRKQNMKQLQEKSSSSIHIQHHPQIKFKQIHNLCVKFLPYLESTNDKSRKLNEIQNISKIELSKTNATPPKKVSYDLGCLVIGDNQGKLTVYALPDPKMMMFDQMKKLEKNKMFEIDAHSDSIWSIDESSQLNGLFNGTQLPRSGSKLTQTRIATASADGTVKLWNINTDGIPNQNGSQNVQFHTILNEFKHTPSIARSVVRDWYYKRTSIISTDEHNNNQFTNKINDKWEDSDIPTSVIFDPMNVANLIVGYVSGDLVRYDIEKGEYNWNRISKQYEPERIISVTKSLTATHYQTQDTIPLLVTTNLGYLHIIDPRDFQTIFSFKAPYSQRLQQTLQIPQQSNSYLQLPPHITNINTLYQVTNNQLRSLNERSPLQTWQDSLKLQLASKRIFTSSTYLQFDCLIAASTNSGQVLMYDLRMGEKGQVSFLIERSSLSQHRQMFDEGITKIAAHPIHPIIVSAGADGAIKVFTSNPQ